MNFLFSSTIVDRGEQLKYRVYEFKLSPGRYAAKLAAAENGHYLKEVIFWKEGKQWKTQPSSTSAKHIAVTIGKEIDERIK